MPWQKSTEDANVTTAADELNRFARYLEFRTRDLRESVTTFLVGPPQPLQPARPTTLKERRQQEKDNDLWDDAAVNIPSNDWVQVTDDTMNVPEDSSGQIYHRPPSPPPGPIQQTGLAAQEAALQALGLTGTYLEHALRLVAEDVGWLTHTVTFEDALRKVRERFPMLKALGESYGRGARRERERRRGEGRHGQRLLEWSGQGDEPVAGSAGGGYQRLSEEERGRFGGMEEV